MAKDPSTYALTCGCVAFLGAERVHSLCAAHNSQWRDLHAQAIREHRDAHPIEDIDLG